MIGRFIFIAFFMNYSNFVFSSFAAKFVPRETQRVADTEMANRSIGILDETVRFQETLVVLLLKLIFSDDPGDRLAL